MIRNRKQLGVSRRKRDELIAAGRQAHPSDRHVYEDLAREVGGEIREYEAVRDGTVDEFFVNSVDELADALVKARISRNWTQQQLAEAIGTSEQMVQKDEAGAYERASLSRLANIADVLGYDLVGSLCRVEKLAEGVHTGYAGPDFTTGTMTVQVQYVFPGLPPNGLVTYGTLGVLMGPVEVAREDTTYELPFVKWADYRVGSLVEPGDCAGAINYGGCAFNGSASPRASVYTKRSEAVA
jgi:DNA-binding XRE family transcriptional regulator